MVYTSQGKRASEDAGLHQRPPKGGRKDEDFCPPDSRGDKEALLSEDGDPDKEREESDLTSSEEEEGAGEEDVDNMDE